MINFLLVDDDQWFILLQKKTGLHGFGGGGGGAGRRRLKISRRAAKALASRRLPQTFLGLDRWVKETVKQARQAFAGPITIKGSLQSAQSSELIELASTEAKKRAANEDADAERLELLIGIFLVRITLLQAQAIARFRDDEETLLLYMLSK